MVWVWIPDWVRASIHWLSQRAATRDLCGQTQTRYAFFRIAITGWMDGWGDKEIEDEGEDKNEESKRSSRNNEA